MGISFCVLAISGLVMLFGKYVLLPVIGYTLFAWLAALAKNLHNFVAPLFIVSVLVFIVMFVKDNLPKPHDFAWFAKAWGMFAGEHVPSGRFNGGREGVVLGRRDRAVASFSAVTGADPAVPELRPDARDHAAGQHHPHDLRLLVIAAAIGHIYMGTVGVEGAYQAMREGHVDETWAKEHHEYWYNEVKGGAKPSPGGAVPAGAPHMKEKQ